MNGDGGEQSILLNDPNSWLVDMGRCGDRYIVVSWEFHGGKNHAGIWRGDADGSNPKQLTDGVFDQYPVCSPDGKLVYYNDSAGAYFSMRVPLEGGQPQPVLAANVKGMYGMGAQAISLDGKRLVFQANINVTGGPQPAIDRLALVNLDSDSRTSPVLLEADPRISVGAGDGFVNTMNFTPDGKSMAYIIRAQGVDNIFVQPLDGSPGQQITKFTSEHIAQFQWSPDGKVLAVARSHYTADVVLLREK